MRPLPLLWLLCACDAADATDPTHFTILPPPDTGEEGSEYLDCVTNLATAAVYANLQDAFDEARSGDVLELCDWRQTSGGVAAVSVSLLGGSVAGTVSLPGGGVNGTRIPRLEVAAGSIFVQDARIEELVVGGAVAVDGGQVETAAVAEGASLTLNGGTITHLSNAGTVTASRGMIRSLSSSGSTILGALDVGSTVVSGGRLVGGGTRFAGTLRVDDGTVVLDDCSVTDPSEDGIFQRGGDIRAVGLELWDTSLDDAHVGLHVEGGTIFVGDLSVGGFSGDAIRVTGGDVQMENISAAGQCRVETASVTATGLRCGSLVATASVLDLADFQASSMAVDGGVLGLVGASLGDLQGTAVTLTDVDADLLDVHITGVDGDDVVTPLPDGGWTVQEVGGTALLVEGGHLHATDMVIYDANDAVVLRGTSADFVDLSIERTWHSGILCTATTLSVFRLRLSDGRGWGVAGVRSDIDLVEPRISDLQLERRTIEVYSESGDHIDDVLSLAFDPAIATWSSQLRVDDPTLFDVVDHGIFWIGGQDDASLDVIDGAITNAGGHGVFGYTTGADAVLSVDGLHVDDVDGAAVLLYGIASSQAVVRDVAVSGLRYNGVAVTGVGDVVLSGLSVKETSTTGIVLDSILSLSASGLVVSDAAGAGVSLEGVSGSLSQVSVSAAETVGIEISASTVGLSEGKVLGTPTGLSCDADSNITSCGGFVFESVGTELDGCPVSCAE